MRIRFRIPHQTWDNEKLDRLIAAGKLGKESRNQWISKNLKWSPAGEEKEVDEETAKATIGSGTADPVDDEAKRVFPGWNNPELMAALQARSEEFEAGMATGDPQYDSEPDDDEGEIDGLGDVEDATLQELGD